MILKAVERAQSGKAGIDASGTAAPGTVPAEAERPFKN
jgi:hypothetical protein